MPATFSLRAGLEGFLGKLSVMHLPDLHKLIGFTLQPSGRNPGRCTICHASTSWCTGVGAIIGQDLAKKPSPCRFFLLVGSGATDLLLRATALLTQVGLCERLVEYPR